MKLFNQISAIFPFKWTNKRSKISPSRIQDIPLWDPTKKYAPGLKHLDLTKSHYTKQQNCDRNNFFHN